MKRAALVDYEGESSESDDEQASNSTKQSPSSVKRATDSSDLTGVNSQDSSDHSTQDSSDHTGPNSQDTSDHTGANSQDTNHTGANSQDKKKSVKRRRLAAPSASLLPTVQVDDPSKHQGRTRSTPHSEGQFAAHVYLSVNVHAQSPLLSLIRKSLEKCVDSTTAQVYRIPSNEPVSTPVTKPAQSMELHISLTRPTFLRAHQRLELKDAVKRAATLCSSFCGSFAQFSELSNDEGTRRFLTLEVGAGHKQMCLLTNALTPTLRSFRQKEFYSDPRFHASFAWTLATPSDAPSDSSEQMVIFPVDWLNKTFGSSLGTLSSYSFEVENVSVKIGKDISRFRLGEQP